MTETHLFKQAADIIKKKAPDFHPRLGIVLGSGSGALADSIQDSQVISYNDLPGFPEISVKGHHGQMKLGYLSGVPVVCLQGRSHTYETGHYDEVKTYVRTLKALGCDYFFATNAAGSFHARQGKGSLVIIKDHINFQPGNPLIGPNDDSIGPRFPAMDNLYRNELREQLLEQAQNLGITLHEGVFACVSGPCYETAAEINAYRILGADIIAMSTVPEVIVAHHCGMKVAAISIVTNLVTGMEDESHDHNEVLKIANQASEKLVRLVQAFVTTL